MVCLSFFSVPPLHLLLLYTINKSLGLDRDARGGDGWAPLYPFRPSRENP